MHVLYGQGVGRQEISLGLRRFFADEFMTALDHDDCAQPLTLQKLMVPDEKGPQSLFYYGLSLNSFDDVIQSLDNRTPLHVICTRVIQGVTEMRGCVRCWRTAIRPDWF